MNQLRVLPRSSIFLTEVLDGLSRPQKHLPCKYFYDERGSHLFERICELPEYYPTRTELAILRRHRQQIVARFGPSCGLIEFGSGASLKTRLLLQELGEAVYFPVDISAEQLKLTARRLAFDFPQIEIQPVCADFTRFFELPQPVRRINRRIVYFSGSTIGNFSPEEARHLLRRIAHLVGPGGGLLIGVDLHKDPALLEPAYNDQAGVTAAFNLNLLSRINRELGADFVLDRFVHQAIYNREHRRIEMHLVSLIEQMVHLAGRRFSFHRGESICTEYSYKYRLHDFDQLARSAGFTLRDIWTDEQQLFSVQFAQVSAS